jgi:two-component system alkaline phosphatase synthesis response regulator PhoP
MSRTAPDLKGEDVAQQSRIKRVLLAEDDNDMRDILGFWLQGEGYEVQTAANGWEAIQKAKDDKPDAIVLDLLMPGVDGFQACRYIRNDPALNHLPVIMFSAVFIDNEERQLGYDVGADEFVAKTSGFNSLLAAIDRAIKAVGEARRKPVDEKMAALVRAEIESVAARFEG